MIIAELKGKIPGKLEYKEDLLTSNVFSFFKYSNRQILKDYFQYLGLIVSLEESSKAEFIFWPSFDDKTEPDLVVICGKYYILFEAKFYSPFSPKTLTKAHQIEREINMGEMAASNADLEFVFIAITAEYYEDRAKYAEYKKNGILFIWTNWQSIASFIGNKLEEDDLKLDKEFATDLHSLLVKKRLRSFTGLISISLPNIIVINKPIYYNIKTSEFKGEFTGFLNNLAGFEKIKPYQRNFGKSFCQNLTTFEISNNQKIYYYGNEPQ